MPKISEQKKLIKKVQPKEAGIQKPVEPKVTVYRVFECVIHLEEALAQLKRVGIFPGVGADPATLKAKQATLVAGTESLLKEYQALWGAMSK